ncbi:MAG TPA: hypothetical protein PK228_10175 [Saprospiraceae bacterium]|nr:hypothetical protein [Saprospiraceae bacterium]
MKILFTLLIVFHGLIHLLGFAKAFNLGAVNQLSQNIPKTTGILWLAAAILFIATAILYFLKQEWWWLPGAVAVVLSQYLIFTSWHDAKFGTLANVLILLVTILGYGTWHFSNTYKNEVIAGLKQTAAMTDSLLTEADLQSLPEPVKKYLRYTGAVGKPKVKNFKVEFAGQIRKDEQSEWMPFTSEQYNFMGASTRLFFMKATMKHLPVAGFHCFKNGDAFMDIRLFSLFKVQYQTGPEMGAAETVTFFNDMCCMAPATLIDKRISWLETDSNNVKAAFANNGITISAWLYFNDRGELTNFISDDRYAVAENNTMKKIRWSTPMKDYKDIDGHRLPGYADAIYNYPEGDLCYGNFRVVNVEYNCR